MTIELLRMFRPFAAAPRSVHSEARARRLERKHARRKHRELMRALRAFTG